MATFAGVALGMNTEVAVPHAIGRPSKRCSRYGRRRWPIPPEAATRRRLRIRPGQSSDIVGLWRLNLHSGVSPSSALERAGSRP